MMQVHTVFAVVVAIVGSCGVLSDRDWTFDEYITKFGRTYPRDSKEYSMRRDIFHQEAQKIQAQNAKPDKLWTAGFNHLTDFTDAEYVQLQGWSGRGRNREASPHGALLTQFTEELNQTVDWRHLSSMQDVRDQGHCGSCWALTTVNMLRANYEIKKKSVRTFSAQELVDCVPNPQECGGKGGCHGATAELAMQYVMEHGLADEETRPYDAQTGHCRKSGNFLERRNLGVDVDAGGAQLGLLGWSQLPENKAEPLMRAVAQGPVAISVAAKPWRGYTGGIFDGCDKDVTLGHAVVLMGYGQEQDVNYWTILNSWGDAWGEFGYIRMLRHETVERDDTHCGQDYEPEKGVECKPYRDQVTVCGMCGMLYDSVAVHFNDS